MLKCAACGRAGGPFRLDQQIAADGQILRAWACPCGHTFHATGGAERSATAHSPYTGFTVEWTGRSFPVRLEQMNRRETVWKVGPWQVIVAGPPSGPGTRFVSLKGSGEEPVAQWRLEASWNATEIARRVRATTLPQELSADLVTRVLLRVLS